MYQELLAVTTGWSKSAASLLTAGWQIGEYQERIELLEMDKELLILEHEQVSQKLAAQNTELLKDKQMLEQQLQQVQPRDADEAEIDEARAHELTRLAREQGARGARKEADAQVKFLLDTGCAEISALNQQVKILMEQLNRVIASKNASLDLNGSAMSSVSAFSQGDVEGGSGGMARRRNVVSSREVAVEEEEWLRRREDGEEDDALTEQSFTHSNRTAASAITSDVPEEDSAVTRSGRSQVRFLNPQTFVN